MRLGPALIALCLGVASPAAATPPTEETAAEVVSTPAPPNVKAEAHAPAAEATPAQAPSEDAEEREDQSGPPTKESLAGLGPEAAYDKGVLAFKAKRFETAVAYFEHAHKLDPNETFLFNIARAYQELAMATRSAVHVEQAIYHFRLYVERAPTGADREDAGARAKALESLAMRLAREAQPVPAVAPSPADKGTQTTITRVAAPVDSGFEIPPAASATLLAGTVCAGLGGVMGLLTHNAMDDFDAARDTPGQAGADAMADAAGRIETFGTGANVAFVAGGTLVATGLILWIVEGDDWLSGVSVSADGVAVTW